MNSKSFLLVEMVATTTMMKMVAIEE